MGAVRLGIIGIGGMGSSHVGYLSRGELNGVELKAVADHIVPDVENNGVAAAIEGLLR